MHDLDTIRKRNEKRVRQERQLRRKLKAAGLEPESVELSGLGLTIALAEAGAYLKTQLGGAGRGRKVR